MRWLLLLLAAGFSACGPGPMTKALRDDIVRLKGEIVQTEEEIAAARQEGASLEDDLAMAVTGASEKLAGRVTGSGHLYLELDAALISKITLALLDDYEGKEPGDGSTPEAVWQLRGLRTRGLRGRMFLSGSYHVQVGKGECEGPVHGHLFYLQRNQLKLAEMGIRCRTRRHDLTIDVPSRLPPVPVPFEIREAQTLGIKEGVKAPAAGLSVITPVEIDLGVERVGVRTRSVTIRKAER